MSRAHPAGTRPSHPAAPPSPAWTAAVNARWLIAISAVSARSYWLNAQSDWPARVPVSSSAAAAGSAAASPAQLHVGLLVLLVGRQGGDGGGALAGEGDVAELGAEVPAEPHVRGVRLVGAGAGVGGERRRVPAEGDAADRGELLCDSARNDAW